MQTNPLAKRILNFWLGDLKVGKDATSKKELWWGKNPSVDEYITTNFKESYYAALEGKYDGWKKSPQESLAFIILLDQFSRHIFRNSPQAFSADEIAVAWAVNGMEMGHDKKLLNIFDRAFFYMPLEHSENITHQKQSVEVFLELYKNCSGEQLDTLKIYYDCAIQHHDIIEQFSRFPHRNKSLKRESTEAELLFLSQPGSSF
jgi:uncharacterized protein (DUF924 family)